MSYPYQSVGKVSTSDVHVRAQGLTHGTTLWLKHIFGVRRIRCRMFTTHNSVSRILVARDCKIMSGDESDRGSTVVDIFVLVADCLVDREATEVLFPSLRQCNKGRFWNGRYTKVD
jgi:hypothetical protein